MVGASDDRVEYGVIKEVTKGVDGSMRGKRDEDVGVCTTGNGEVEQSSKISKTGGIVDGVVEIPREGNKEDGGIEWNPRGGDI